MFISRSQSSWSRFYLLGYFHKVFFSRAASRESWLEWAQRQAAIKSLPEWKKNHRSQFLSMNNVTMFLSNISQWPTSICFGRKRRIGSCEGCKKHSWCLTREGLPMTTYLNCTWPNCLELSRNFDIQPPKNLDLFPKIGPGPIMRTLVTNGPRDGWMVQALSKSWHRQKPWYQT